MARALASGFDLRRLPTAPTLAPVHGATAAAAAAAAASVPPEFPVGDELAHLRGRRASVPDDLSGLVDRGAVASPGTGPAPFAGSPAAATTSSSVEERMRKKIMSGQLLDF